jgi:hypothetical protein
VLAKIAAALLALAVVGFIAIYFSLSQSALFKGPEGLPAPVAWTTRSVVLSAAEPIAHGQLTVGGGGAPAGTSPGAGVGVNAGTATQHVTGADPGAIISGPVVRLTVTGPGGTTRSCFAPCEMRIAEAYDCSASRCGVTVDLRVELVSGAVGAATVAVDIAGGWSASLQQHLPDPFDVDLRFDPAGGSG